MSSFRERNPITIAVAGLVVIAALMALALSSGSLVDGFFRESRSAAFAEAGGIREGDEVRVYGRQVGRVESVTLDGTQVLVAFDTDDGLVLGADTRAAVRTATPLGKKFLELDPAGSGELDGVIPVARTQSAYDVNQALSDLTTTVGQVDTGQLGRALSTVADTFADTPDELRGALAGVQALSTTIASRDQALRDLLKSANQVTGVLADRRDQIAALFADANRLLGELQQRQGAIEQIFGAVTAAAQQLSGLNADSRESLKPTLDELNSLLTVLDGEKQNIALAMQRVGPLATALAEAVGSIPGFLGYIHNIVPTNMIPEVTRLLQEPG